MLLRYYMSYQAIKYFNKNAFIPHIYVTVSCYACEFRRSLFWYQNTERTLDNRQGFFSLLNV